MNTPIGAWRFYQAGREAMRSVPGMQRKIVNGFFINLALFVILVSVFNAGCFFFAWYPALNYLTGKFSPTWDWAAWVLVGALAASFVMLSLLFAFRFSIRLMGFWYEGMIEMVVDHFHPGIKRPNLAFDFKELLRVLFRELLLIGSIVLLGFVPLIGGIAVFYFSCSLMGYSVFDPYLSVLKANGWQEQAPQLKRWSLRLFLLGIPQFLLAFVPMVGWFWLPWFMLCLVLGQSWIYARGLELQSIAQSTPEPSST